MCGNPGHPDVCDGSLPTCDILASGPISTGYNYPVSSYPTAADIASEKGGEWRIAARTHVEGREAPCPHGGLSRTACITCNRDGAAFRFSNDPSWPNADGLQLSAGGTATLAGPGPDAATVEACARAAFEAWAGQACADKAVWREVARAVLAAAGRGGK